MASDIPGYDVQDEVPWNTDSGKNLAPARGPMPLAFGTDIFTDPGAIHSVSDPASGFDSPGQRVSEV